MASEKDLEDYKKLKDLGATVQIQYVPSDKITPIEKFLG